MHKLHFILSFFIFICFSFFAPVKAQDPEPRLKRLLKESDYVGLSVAVVKDGKIIYTNALGLKDVAAQTPLSKQDIFRIASISKSFSATAIMQLVEAGKLSLDDDVSDLIGFSVRNPKFPEIVITLKMLLSHTSSINDKNRYFSLDIINPEKGSSWKSSYSDYAPGTDYKYCNLNFNMIGAIIERFSGQRFDDYIKEHILDPLDLYGGYHVDSLNADLFASIYRYKVDIDDYVLSTAAYTINSEIMDNYQLGYSAPVFSPTGGMKISAPHLAKYMIMHMNQGTANGVEIISAESAGLMQTPVPNGQGYGLALRKADDLIEGKVLKGHTGSAYGLYSAMFFHPEEKFGFVLITNGGKPQRTNGVNNMLLEGMKILHDEFIK